MCCNATLWDRDGVCIQQLGDTSNDQNNNPTRGPNNPGACLANADYAGKWVEFGGWWTDEPQCERTPFSRDNHLGNSVPKASESGGLGAMSRAPSYKWKIPDDVLKKTGRESARCVLRMRYNISTTDFDDWSIDATLNGNDAPVKQDPAADFLGLSSSTSLGTDYPLKLNIATNQYGRTFEDRSHTFQIRRRDGAGSCKDKEIHNLNIRGRRGNIVQVYPAVEYDYVPNKLEIFEGECVHFQWTGSDANPRGNAGNGRQMTDRVNIVEIPELGKNVPTKLGYDAVADGVEDDLKHESLLGDEAFVKRLAYLDQELNCTSGTCIPTLSCDDDQTNNQAISNCKELNAARGYFDTGPVQLNTPLFYTKTQSVHFMSTRNNDFTNRSQKGTIVIKAWKFGLILGLVIFALCALVFFGYLNARKAHYDPEHRLHRNKFGRWVIKMGKRAEKLYERSPLAKVPYTCGLIVMCAAFYAIGYYHAIGGDPAPYFVHAKGCGRVLDLLCNLIFVPVLRNLTSWLRTTSLSNVLPLGEELYFHKTIAVIMSLAAAGHILSHYLDYQWHAAYGTGTSLAEQAVGTWTGISGHLIALMMILMFSTALEKVRRRRWLRKTKWAFGGHSLFVRVHKLWIPVLVLLWSHSKAFWHYSLAPTTLILLDKLIARLRGKEPVELVEASSPTRDVIALKMRKRNHRKFRYKSGQCAWLDVAMAPGLSPPPTGP